MSNIRSINSDTVVVGNFLVLITSNYQVLKIKNTITNEYYPNDFNNLSLSNNHVIQTAEGQIIINKGEVIIQSCGAQAIFKDGQFIFKDSNGNNIIKNTAVKINCNQHSVKLNFHDLIDDERNLSVTDTLYQGTLYDPYKRKIEMVELNNETVIPSPEEALEIGKEDSDKRFEEYNNRRIFESDCDDVHMFNHYLEDLEDCKDEDGRKFIKVNGHKILEPPNYNKYTSIVFQRNNKWYYTDPNCSCFCLELKNGKWIKTFNAWLKCLKYFI